MKILATVDGSVESRAIIATVQKLASAAHADVKLINVIQPAGATAQHPRRLAYEAVAGQTPSGVQVLASVLTPSDGGYAESKEQAIDRVEFEAREFLDDVAKPLTDAGIHVDRVVAVSTDPVEAIVRYARSEGVDLIAMATHGHTGLREVVQGSVAAAVVKSGVAPVLLVRPGPR